MSATYRSMFFASAESWICDNYFLTIRYLASIKGDEKRLIDAAILLVPLFPPALSDFQVKANNLIAGQITLKKIDRRNAIRLLEKAAEGTIQVGKSVFTLGDEKKHYYTEMLNRDRWFSELHLQISGSQLPPIEQHEAILEDSALRTGRQPFDGVSDVAGLLGLVDRRGSSQSSGVTLRVVSPVDIDFGKTSVENNQFRLELRAHAKLDVNRIGVALRIFPGNQNNSRSQIGGHVVWGKRASANVRTGVVALSTENADSALVMLTLGQQTVRRQWFLDPIKATNRRLMATQLFDRDLKQLRSAVIDPTDSSKFEAGIASMLFILGFSPALQLETQAPDILVTTPGGLLILVECTIRVSDFSTKVGKLVDRQRMLLRALQDNGQSIGVEAVLVSAQARDQLVSDESALAQRGITLICREQLLEAFNQLRFPRDPDVLIEQAARRRASIHAPL